MLKKRLNVIQNGEFGPMRQCPAVWNNLTIISILFIPSDFVYILVIIY